MPAFLAVLEFSLVKEQRYSLQRLRKMSSQHALEEFYNSSGGWKQG